MMFSNMNYFDWLLLAAIIAVGQPTCENSPVCDYLSWWQQIFQPLFRYAVICAYENTNERNKIHLSIIANMQLIYFHFEIALFLQKFCRSGVASLCYFSYVVVFAKKKAKLRISHNLSFRFAQYRCCHLKEIRRRLTMTMTRLSIFFASHSHWFVTHNVIM